MTPTNEAGHGLPELPAPNKIAHDLLIDLRAAAAIGRPITGDEIHEIEQRMIATLALSRGVPADMVLDRPARVGGRDFKAGELVQRVVGRAHAEYDRHHGGCLRHPYTGELRDYRDVESDPDGTLCVGPGPLQAAPAAAGAQGEVTGQERDWSGRIDDAWRDVMSSNNLDPLDDNIWPITAALAYAQQAWRRGPLPPHTPQPAAADGGVRERARELLAVELEHDGFAETAYAVRSGWNVHQQAPALRVIEALSSHRQAGDGLSKFRELAEGWRANGHPYVSDCADELIALVEKGAGS